MPPSVGSCNRGPPAGSAAHRSRRVRRWETGDGRQSGPRPRIAGVSARGSPGIRGCAGCIGPRSRCCTGPGGRQNPRRAVPRTSSRDSSPPRRAWPSIRSVRSACAAAICQRPRKRCKVLSPSGKTRSRSCRCSGLRRARSPRHRLRSSRRSTSPLASPLGVPRPTATSTGSGCCPPAWRSRSRAGTSRPPGPRRTSSARLPPASAPRLGWPLPPPHAAPSCSPKAIRLARDGSCATGFDCGPRSRLRTRSRAPECWSRKRRLPAIPSGPRWKRRRHTRHSRTLGRCLIRGRPRCCSRRSRVVAVRGQPPARGAR